MNFKMAEFGRAAAFALCTIVIANAVLALLKAVGLSPGNVAGGVSEDFAKIVCALTLTRQRDGAKWLFIAGSIIGVYESALILIRFFGDQSADVVSLVLLVTTRPVVQAFLTANLAIAILSYRYGITMLVITSHVMFNFTAALEIHSQETGQIFFRGISPVGYVVRIGALLLFLVYQWKYFLAGPRGVVGVIGGQQRHKRCSDSD